jgi:hypothetical protein
MEQSTHSIKRLVALDFARPTLIAGGLPRSVCVFAFPFFSRTDHNDVSAYTTGLVGLLA